MNTKELTLKKPGRKVANPDIMEKLLALKTGQEIVINKKDWKLKTPPGRHVLRRRTGQEFSVASLADDSGWLITRIAS